MYVTLGALRRYNTVTVQNLVVTGTLTAQSTEAITGATTITSTSANALVVGANGATNPVLKVNANTASVATGLSVTGAAAASGVAIAALSSGTDENVKFDAKGAGTLTLNSIATGAISLARATDVVGNFSVATNKFTVAAASGNTVVAGTLGSTGLVTASAGINSADALTMTVAAKGLVLKQGANGLCGTFVANGSTPVTVNNSSIAITDSIIISLNTVGGTVGVQPHVATITASTSFTVVCTASDTSTYNYAIIKNAA